MIDLHEINRRSNRITYLFGDPMKSTSDLYDSTGRVIALGKKIAAGGEGAVYEVKGFGGDLVAKIYHEIVSIEKQSKLWDMVNGVDESLKKIAAWPLASLHPNAGGPIRGFLMPKLVGYEPIHHLYGPSHRKQRYPDKDWAFLVNTARNMAAAFETIHGHGHVIGDVNPNLVFVARNSIVKLIDCDSFQIVANGKHYLCEVGVPHFTPPELQNYSSFRGVRRTQNHDNFGLALLLFHILLMGRHPFAGVFSGSGDMPLEKSIQQFRYAYGQNAATKLMVPPPKSVTSAILPGVVAQLFESAFSQQGYQLENRPTAREWVKVLDTLKQELNNCKQDLAHKYFSGLPTCPWCLQEQQSGTVFFIACKPKVAVIPRGFKPITSQEHYRAYKSHTFSSSCNQNQKNKRGQTKPTVSTISWSPWLMFALGCASCYFLYLFPNENSSYTAIPSSIISAPAQAVHSLSVKKSDLVSKADSWQTIGRYQVKRGLVKDTQTNLMWMRCSLGQNWRGSTCYGEAEKYALPKSIENDLKNFSYDSYTDWRVPTIAELNTLVYCSSGKPKIWKASLNPDYKGLEYNYVDCDGDYVEPTIMSGVFPETPNDDFWSSSANRNSESVLLVDFSDGGIHESYPNFNFSAVRLVRSSN